jgi:dienelactone hydrolase
MAAFSCAHRSLLRDIRSLAIGLTTFVGCLVAAQPLAAEQRYGAFGPEGPRMREQLWIVPGAEPDHPLRATLFKPQDDGQAMRRPLVVINHGSDAATREAVAMPVFYWLSRWFVLRGFVVLVPQRRGHGATGGEFAEGRDSCSRPDHWAAGQSAADDIEAAIRFMREQPFIDNQHIVVAGTSTGGWASLAVAGRSIPGVRLAVNFAGGRGGHAFGRRHAVCARERLVETAGRFASVATIPTVWFYSRNDSYFGPDLAEDMAGAWRRSGGLVDLKLLPAYGPDGHELVADRGSWPLWENDLAQHLATVQGVTGQQARPPAEVAAATNEPAAASAGR